MPNQTGVGAVDFAGSIFLESSSVRANVNRLNWRAEVLIRRNIESFRGKRVLDLASHDGRFMHAALANGAKKVIGVEAREEHVAQARHNLGRVGYAPDSYEVLCGDLVEHLKSMAPGSIDTILCFGVFSHLIEQVEIIREIRRIAPSTFILDTWVAMEQWNLGERIRNHRVNLFVKDTQQGGDAGTSLLARLKRLWTAVVPGPGSKVGNLVFLYEDPQAPGATVRPSGLMAWTNRSVVEMLFEHYGLDYERVDWRAQRVTDWTDLGDYRRGARETWIARPARGQAGR
ncbi:class I SAM-dependent methyltransferase [Burkholderia ubonensis]|uniref:SAM-dependent methyltransferase n=1 Tax=Burkholderia ubonensis subsp. mesacidophila TaxID=265293 RepID=A0A2A4FJ10_9BURK|nr:class I SAM-dependent methyltransferase [Burkholderia ubonensis]PCE33713.1 SAM-dependent methyltransferase [Burkholderia ubonensis subsp. mesacidophila]